MLHEAFGDLRGIVNEGILLAVYDGGSVQTIDVQTHDGVVRSGIEVHQCAGFASMPQLGGKVILIAVGGDPANMRALPVSDATRYGNQAPGERTMYCPDGTRVSVRPGGLVEIWGGNQVTVHSPLVVVNAPNGVQITGNVTITGDMLVSGNISDQDGASGTLQALRAAYDAHRHPYSAGTTGLTDHTV